MNGGSHKKHLGIGNGERKLVDMKLLSIASLIAATVVGSLAHAESPPVEVQALRSCQDNKRANQADAIAAEGETGYVMGECPEKKDRDRPEEQEQRDAKSHGAKDVTPTAD